MSFSNKLKLGILSGFTLLGLIGIGILAPAGAKAADPFFDEICKGAGSKSPACQDKEETISGNEGIVLKAANLVAIFAGVAGVIMIMVGGFQYITANGDSSKISSAKNVIIYALVGLLIVALARTIVGFVIGRVI